MAVNAPKHDAVPRWGPPLFGAIGVALGVVAWQLIGSSERVLVNTPGAAAAAVRDLAASGELWAALRSSGLLFLTGLIAATVVGVVGGLLVARYRVIQRGTEWILYLLHAVPIVAITPLVLAAAGFGLTAKSFVVFFSAVFPIAISTIEGAKRVPSTLLDVAQVYDSPERRIWIDLLIPHALPYAMSGLRQGIAMAVVGTLAAEFFLNASGVGGLLLAAGARFDSAAVLGLTVLVAVVAVAIIGLGRLGERLVAPWNTEDAR